jgi:hypothetical protein
MMTLAPQFSGQRCTDPGHWQAAGLLVADDYYKMAQLMVWTAAEQAQAAVEQETIHFVATPTHAFIRTSRQRLSSSLRLHLPLAGAFQSGISSSL